MPKYLDTNGLRTLWAQITNKISQESNATAEALEGKADLVEGKIPASQLPSYVDDVLEYANKASFPATGESGKIYLDLATNLTYRWGGTAYTEISPSLALGTTSSTAYRGDYGAAAYTHAVTNKGIAKTSGLYKITTNAEGHVTAATAVVKADITGLGIPAQDTTYENATTTTNGLMSSTDKTKLDSINLSDLVKSVNGITPDSNGNIAIEIGGGTVSGDYLPLTGGTTTGKVYLANGSGVYGTDTSWTSISFRGADEKIRCTLMLSDTNRFHVNQQETGASYAERYLLPTVATDLTGDVWYTILTSKNTVTIAQGGTGATDAATACTNLGAIKKSGDTITGSLKSIQASQAYTIGTSAKPTLTTISMGTNDPGTRMYFTHYDQNSSYYDNFVLPATKDLTKNGNYWILTTKSPVTVAQGGTGATDAATAMDNLNGRRIFNHYSQLGLTEASTSYEIWAALPNDSSFVAHNSNYSQVTDTPNGYGIVQITKTNNNYGAGSFTRVNVATSDFYQASFYLNRTFDGWRKVITSEGGVFNGNLEIRNGTDESTIHFTPSNSNAYGGILYYYKPTSSDKDRSRWGFRQYSFSASDPNTRTEHAYTYYLPKTPSGLTASSTYEILTTKSAVTVAQGGTGKTTLTSGYALIGNGASAVTLRAITNNTAKGSLGWTSATGTNLVTTNTLAYWNGSYTGTSSNISILGTITTGIWNGSAIPVTHGGTGATDAATARTNLGITDTKVAQTSTNPTTSTKYYPLAGSSSSTTTAGAVFNSAFNVNFKNGTASAEGDIELVLGNSTATGTAGNKTGWLCLYSPGTSYHMIKPASTNSALTHTLPAKSGTILNTGTFVASTTAPSSPITGMFWVDIS